MMKKLILSCISVLLLVTSSYSQAWKYRRYEIYGGIPAMHYFGDIGGSAEKSNLFGLRDISFKALRPGLSVGGIYKVNERISVSANYVVGQLHQSDIGSRNEARNFAFSTFINELSVQCMFFIKPESERNYYYSVMQLRGGLKELNKPLSAYVFTGVAGTFFSVTPEDDFVDSDRFTKKSFAMGIPLGLGAKFAYSSQISFSAELSARFLLSDYVDGFTSPSSKHNDLYYLMNFKVIYRLPKATPRRRSFSR